MALGRLRADAALGLWVAVPVRRYPVIKCSRQGSQELQVPCLSTWQRHDVAAGKSLCCFLSLSVPQKSKACATFVMFCNVTVLLLHRPGLTYATICAMPGLCRNKIPRLSGSAGIYCLLHTSRNLSAFRASHFYPDYESPRMRPTL